MSNADDAINADANPILDESVILAAIHQKRNPTTEEATCPIMR